MRSLHFSLLSASLAALLLPVTTVAEIAGRDWLGNVAQVGSRELHNLNPRADDPFNGQVSLEYLSSGDGTTAGSDPDNVWYIQKFVTEYLSRITAERRNGVFWAGGATTGDDMDNVDEFIEGRLSDNGVKAFDVYPITDFEGMGMDGTVKTQHWWRAINRMSKALALSCSGNGIAYVYLKPINCRTIFSPPSQNPLDSDPEHGNVPTNGEIWYYAELPTLMRNPNIKQIKTFYKKDGDYRFTVDLAWDADADAATHPRTEFDDIVMDASPITLPAAAGRDPLKRRSAFIPLIGRSNSTLTTAPLDVDTTTTFQTLIYPSSTPSSIQLTTAIETPAVDSTTETTASTSLLAVSIDTSVSTSVIVIPTETLTPTSYVQPTTVVGTPTTDTTTELPTSTLISSVSIESSVSNATPSSLPADTTTVPTSLTETPSQIVPQDTTTESSYLSGTGSASSTAFVSATTTDPATTSATTGAVVIPGLVVVDGTTVITGGDVTSPIPITVTTSIDPKGTEASSSAIEIQSSVINLALDIQNFIDNPSKDKADNANDNIVILLPLVTTLFGSLSGNPDPSPKPCSASTNLITTLFNAVSCLVDNLTKTTKLITDSVMDNFTDLTDLTNTLALLKGLEDPLDTENDEDDDDDDDNSTQTEDQSSTEASTASTTESTTETCTATVTASDCLAICPTSISGVTNAATASCTTTCFSTISGCDVTAYTTTSYTAEACLLPTGDLAAPTGAFTEVWWDYGISCAGDCAAYTVPAASIDGVTATASASGQTSGQTTATSTDGAAISGILVNTPSATTVTSVLSTPVSSTFVTSTRTAVSSVSTSDVVLESTTPGESTTTDQSSTADESTTVLTTTPRETTTANKSTTVLTTTPGETTTPGVTTTADTLTTTENTIPSTTAAADPTIEGWPFCVNHGGPNVATPYCQCSTTTEGQTFFATATLISGQCASYTSFPSDVTLAPITTAVATTAAPEPYIETESNGDVLSYPDRTYEYGDVYTGIKVTFTIGVGTPVTISTPVPTQTDSNDSGSSQCHSIDDACDRAYAQFEDDKVYTGWTSYYSRVQSGMIMVASFGQAGCTAQFECDDYGIGMTGAVIKDA
ncbi:hypothetical protein G7Z17_g1787 [Cylindrodendrum hubeiense]|uniref:Uncharacterized protein n=1 Tax=Cylindrodendrum hubeiense TaxID=595255 RepID=A0A9P5LL21_9HYPO|nr:hypothetical protein G7Z17_g1787 [Cylindrodendrum hubeiense]